MALQSLTQAFPAINNPYIQNVYLNKEFSDAGEPTEVLVIETNLNLRNIKPGSSDNERLNDLLLDLDRVQALVEGEGRSFDCVDIRESNDVTKH